MAKKIEDLPEIPKPDLTDDEKKFRSMIIDEIESARNQREQSYPEFDDMTYEEYYISNAKAANAYIPPKQNEQDVRTTSGTTHEKANTLLSSLLNYELEADVESYDKDDRLINELGDTMESMIKKSRKIEKPDYELKRAVIYKELLDQGTVFVEDRFDEFILPDKVVEEFDMTDLDKIKWSERIDVVQKFCNTNLLSGLDVYLGNIREFYMEFQPYVIFRRLRPRAEMEAKYGTWERWKNVPRKIEKTADLGSDTLAFHDWSMKELQDNMVEELMYMNKWTNNYMIMLNGVPMFPVRRDNKGRLSTFPLSAINGQCEYPLAKGDLEPITRYFAYSKSIPAKTKVDQALFDEMLKAIVLKTRKSYQPPMANNTGTALSKKIFYPATIHPNVNPEKLQEIGTNNGVTQPEFNAVSFIKEIIDNKSVSPVFEGQSLQGQQTAREIIEIKQRSMVKLGIAILGVVSLEKKLSTLRIYSILKNWTEPVDWKVKETANGISEVVKQYKTITTDAMFENGQEGKRIINFTDDIPEDEQVYAEEEIIYEKTGEKVRINYLHAERVKNIPNYWHIEVTPSEKETSALKTAQFEDFLQKIFALFAPFGKMPDLNYLAERYAILQGENPDKVWQQTGEQGVQEQQMQQQLQGQSMGNSSQQQGGQLNSQLKQGLKPMQEQKPSINTLVNQ